MIIGIDGNEANIENRVGVHQYAFEILWGIYKNAKSKKGEEKKDTFIVYLKKEPLSDFPKETKWWKYKILSGGKVWILSKLTPHLLLHREVDVLFSPSHYSPIVSRIPIVATIHDLGYLESSEQFKKNDFWQLKLWTAKTISHSRRLVSVSQSTKKDLVRHYPKSKEKISVVYHGYDSSKFNSTISDKIVDNVKRKYRIKNDYILFLSMLKPSKNIEGLLKAFKIFSDRTDYDISLVIAGKKGWLFDTIFRTVKELYLEDKVIFTDFVPENDKPSLYYGARLFAIPAFWEGFGMTALEAMATGTPVVASAVGGLPEVVSEAGEIVDPQNPEDIARGIEKIISLSKSDYSKLQKQSLAQARKFSWEKAAKETLEVIKSVVK